MNDEEHFKLMIRGAVERGRIAERTRIAALCTHEYPDIKTQYERLRHENFMLKHENRLLKDQVKAAGHPPFEPMPISVYLRDALFGLGFEVRTMRDTPLDQLDVRAALRRVEDEVCRIGGGLVGEADLIG